MPQASRTASRASATLSARQSSPSTTTPPLVGRVELPPWCLRSPPHPHTRSFSMQPFSADSFCSPCPGPSSVSTRGSEPQRRRTQGGGANSCLSAAIYLPACLWSSATLRGNAQLVVRALPARCRLSQIISKNPKVNWLSFARSFLFSSRDLWFEVTLPYFLRDSIAGLGWRRAVKLECRGPRVPLGSEPGLLYSPPAVVLLLAPSLPASSSCMGRFSRGHLSWSSSRSSRARPTSCTHPCGPAHWRVDTRLASPRPGLSASLGPDVHASLRAAGPRGVPRGLHPGLEHFHRSPDQRHDWSPRFGCVPGPSVDLRCPGRDSRIELQVLCSRPPIRSQAQVSWCSASSSPSTLPSIRI